MNMSEVDTDILYSVSISNVTDEGHPTAISYDNCSNLTETYCVFSPDIPAPCREQKYNFTVIPSNGAGQGESSQSVIGSFDSGKDVHVQCKCTYMYILDIVGKKASMLNMHILM